MMGKQMSIPQSKRGKMGRTVIHPSTHTHMHARQKNYMRTHTRKRKRTQHVLLAILQSKTERENDPEAHSQREKVHHA